MVCFFVFLQEKLFESVLNFTAQRQVSQPNSFFFANRWTVFIQIRQSKVMPQVVNVFSFVLVFEFQIFQRNKKVLIQFSQIRFVS